MISWASLLGLTHLIGLALGMGAATVKLALLLRCTADRAFLPVYLAVARPVTRHIVLGMVLLTLSGLGWLVLGYPLTRVLALKLVLVGALWVLGPLVDHVFEPRFRALAPVAGTPASPDFIRARARYLVVEAVATATFYVIVVMWVLQ